MIKKEKFWYVKYSEEEDKILLSETSFIEKEVLAKKDQLFTMRLFRNN